MLAAQAAQLKELDAMFERDNKEMKSTQAKVLVSELCCCCSAYWQQRYEKYSGHSGAYLNFVLEVVVVVGNKSVYSTQAKMLVPCRSCCV